MYHMPPFNFPKIYCKWIETPEYKSKYRKYTAGESRPAVPTGDWTSHAPNLASLSNFDGQKKCHRDTFYRE